MNVVALKGRIARMEDLRYTQSGTAIINFTVAVNRRFSKENEADFINVTAWKKTAEFVAQYFKKGQEIALTGHLQVSTYEKDGQKHWRTDVVAETVEFCGSKSNGSNGNSNGGNGSNHAGSSSGYSDPFLGEEITFDDEMLPF